MNDDLVVVTSGDHTLIGIAKSILDGEGIEYAVMNEKAPYRRRLQLLVRREDEARVEELLAELTDSYDPIGDSRDVPRAIRTVYAVVVLGGVAFGILAILWQMFHR